MPDQIPGGLLPVLWGALGLGLGKALDWFLAREKDARDERKELREERDAAKREVSAERDLRRDADIECDKWREKYRLAQTALDEKHDSLSVARDLVRKWDAEREKRDREMAEIEARAKEAEGALRIARDELKKLREVSETGGGAKRRPRR